MHLYLKIKVRVFTKISTLHNKNNKEYEIK